MIEITPKRSADQSGRSLKKYAPAGTTKSGVIVAMNSTWAMLVFVTAVNSSEMFTPKNRPAGATSTHVWRSGNGRR